MAFTFSHPAVILSLGQKKWGLSMSGLIAGSIAPDFEYFMRMRAEGYIGHEPMGILLFDLPVALLLCYLFHCIVRDILILHLPDYYYSRLRKLIDFDWNKHFHSHPFRVLLSISIGIGSHLLWDSLTHHDGLIVGLVTPLNHVFKVANLEVPVYSVFQIVSSIWGLYVISKFIADMPAGKVLSTGNRSLAKYWKVVTICAAFILSFRLVLLSEDFGTWDLVFSMIGSCLWGCSIASLLYFFINRFTGSTDGKRWFFSNLKGLLSKYFT